MTHSLQQKKRSHSWLAWGVYAYLLGILVCWGMLFWGADRRPLSTLLAFGPRWVLGIPLGILSPLCWGLRKDLLKVLSAVAVVWFFPIWGFNVPWKNVSVELPMGSRLKLLSCNMGGNPAVWDHLRLVVEERQPDFIILQEAPQPPSPEWLSKVGHVCQKAGMIVISPTPCRITESLDWRDLGSGAVLIVEAEWDNEKFRLGNIHLPTPRDGIESVLAEKFQGLQRLQEVIDHRWDASKTVVELIDTVPGPLLLAGDFNMPEESGIYKDHWSDFDNAFFTAGWGWGHTKLTNWYSARVDHVLVGPGWVPLGCETGPFVGSDHVPVWAEVGRVKGSLNE